MNRCILGLLILSLGLTKGAGVCDPADVVLVVDGSLSIGITNFNTLKNEIANFVKQIPVTQAGVHVGLVLFSTSVDKTTGVIDLSGDENQLVAAINALPFPGGGTLTHLGINEGLNMVLTSSRPNVPKKLVIITDGQSNIPSQTQISASNTKQAGIETYSLGVGSGVNDAELNQIASFPGPSYVQKATDFSSVYSSLKLLSINECVEEPTTLQPTTFLPTTPAKPLPVPRTPQNCGADIVFIVDASDETKSGNIYNDFLTTLRNFVIQQPISDNDLRMGIVFTNDVKTVEIPISGNPFEIYTKINQNINPLGGELLLGTGLTSAVNVFNSDNLPRNVPRVSIVLTAGSSKGGAIPFFQSNNLKYTTAGRTMAVHSIGVSTPTGPRYNQFELGMIATAGNNVQTFLDTTNLLAAISNIAVEECKSYVQITPAPLTQAPTTTMIPTTTQPPTTQRPITLAPTTHRPITLAPTTQRVTTLAPVPTTDPLCGADVVFVVDSSDNTKGGNVYTNFIQSLKSFLIQQKIFNDAFRVGVVFTNDVQAVKIPISGDRNGLLSQINNNPNPLGGGLLLANGINGAIDLFNNDQNQRTAPRVVILLTSGRSRGGAIPTAEVAQLKSMTGPVSMTVYSIGVTSLNGIFYNSNELSTIASSPSQVITLPDTNAVLPNFNNIASSECRTIPKLNYCRPTDIVLVIDGSMSIGMSAFDSLKRNLVQFATDLPVSQSGINVGVVTFSSNVNPADDINLTGDLSSLSTAITNLPYPEGGTRTDLGIDEGRQMLEQRGRSRTNQVMVVITDGYSDEMTLTKVAAEKTKANGVDVYALGVGNSVIDQELQDIASGADKVKTLSDFNLIIPSFLQLGRSICVTLPPQPTNAPTTLPTTQPAVTAAPGCAADIVFIIDASDVTKGGNLYTQFLDIVKGFVSQQKISDKDLRVGVVFTNDVQSVQIPLSGDPASLTTQLNNNQKQLGGGLLLANGINGAINVFETDNFKRSAPRVAVLLTIGRSRGGAVPTAEANNLRTLSGSPVSVYSIAVESINGPFYNDMELQAIASNPGQIQKKQDTTNLLQTFSTIASDNCNVMETPNYCDPYDIVLVVDGSMSIGVNAFKNLKSNLRDFVTDLPVSANGINVGVTTFSSSVDPQGIIDITGDLVSLRNDISLLPYPEGGTRTDLGVDQGREMLQNSGRVGVKKVMVVITDGYSDNPSLTKIAADKTKANGVDVYALGVGNGVVESELEDIASAPENVKRIADFNLIIPSFLQLGRATICVTPDPPSTTRAMPTTTAPTTIITTLPPTTQPPVTAAPTTTMSPTTPTTTTTTLAPTTTMSTPTTTTTTLAPTTTLRPTTMAPPTTLQPTMPPMTEAPVTNPPITGAPVTNPPGTGAPVTTPSTTTMMIPSTSPGPECSSDIVFVVDASDITKGGDLYNDFVQTIEDFIDQQPDISNTGKRVGVVFTNIDETVEIPLSGNKDFLKAHLANNTQQLGGGLLLSTGLNGAIDMFNNDALKRDVPRTTIVLTAGRSKGGVLPKYESEALRGLSGGEEMSVNAIGVESLNGPNFNEAELGTITGNLENVVKLPDTSTLLQNINEIVARECKVVPDQQGCNPRDIVLVVDGSASIGSNSYDTLKSNLVNFTKQLTISPEQDNVGVVVYSSSGVASEIIPLSDDPVALEKAIKDLPYPEGGTMTNLGIDAGSNMLQSGRPGATDTMVVITDGYSDLPEATQKAADKTKRAGANIYTIGVGRGVDNTELYGIASNPRNVQNAPNFESINIPLIRPKEIVCEPSCPVDVVFIVDASDGTKAGDIYDNFLDSIRSFVRQQNIANIGTRVGVVFSNSQSAQTVKIPLSGERPFIMSELDRNSVPLGNGQMLANGLNGAVEVFNENQLNRDSHRVAILLTAGRSRRGVVPTAEAAALKTLVGSPISVYSMGIESPSGTLYNKDELNAIASNPPNDVYELTDINQLLNNYNQIVDGTCNSGAPPTPYTTPAPPTTPASCNPRDIVLVVDGSASIGAANFQKLKRNIANYALSLPVTGNDINLGLVAYSSTVTSTGKIPLTSDKAALEAAIMALPYPEAGTRTDIGINSGLTMLDTGRTGEDKVLIVITDGYSDNLELTKNSSEAAKAAGTTVYAVGVGGDVLDSELSDIASGARYVERATDFDTVLDSLNIGIPEVSVCDPPPTTPAPGCAEPLDVILVVDGSGSIRKTNFAIQMQSIADIMPELNISPDTVNLGLVLFSGIIDEEIPLSTNATALSSTIAAIDYPASRTRTDLGIVRAHEMFNTTGRPNVPQHLVVITDGASQERKLTKEAVAAAKGDGITIHAMGVGDGINEEELNIIATNSTYLTIAPQFEDLKTTLKDMVTTLCG